MNNIFREGYHPTGRDGGKESWRDFKGVNQVAGLFGKAKSPDGSYPANVTGHYPRPSSNLKDPASFAPPPKRVLAAPPKVTNCTGPRTGHLPPKCHISANGDGEIAPGSENTESPPRQEPSLPPKLPAWRNPSTFALDQSVAHEPKPGAEANGNSHLSATIQIVANGHGENTEESGNAERSSAKKQYPPKLPARNNHLSFESSAPIISSPPPYHSVVHDTNMNSAAVDRLGKAGVSVPGLSIGQMGIASRMELPNSASSPHSQPTALQARSSNIAISSSPLQASSPKSPTPSAALIENQAAFRTAQTFHQDPFSVSPTEARSAAKTVDIFRQRHQEQISALDQKYNVTGKMTKFLDKLASPPPPVLQQNSSNATVKPADISDRKPPPPQPPKKPSGMHGRAIATMAPPPVPLGTKPSLGVVGGSWSTREGVIVLQRSQDTDRDSLVRTDSAPFTHDISHRSCSRDVSSPS